MKLFAAALAEARREYNLSQRELGKRSGIDRSFISRLEWGDREPSRETVRALARAFGDQTTADTLYIAAGMIPDRIMEAIAAGEVAPDRVLITVVVGADGADDAAA